MFSFKKLQIMSQTVLLNLFSAVEALVSHPGEIKERLKVAWPYISNAYKMETRKDTSIEEVFNLQNLYYQFTNSKVWKEELIEIGNKSIDGFDIEFCQHLSGSIHSLHDGYLDA